MMPSKVPSSLKLHIKKETDISQGQLQNVIQDLYAIMVQTNGYDTNLPSHPSKVTLEREMHLFPLQTIKTKVCRLTID